MVRHRKAQKAWLTPLKDGTRYIKVRRVHEDSDGADGKFKGKQALTILREIGVSTVRKALHKEPIRSKDGSDTESTDKSVKLRES